MHKKSTLPTNEVSGFWCKTSEGLISVMHIQYLPYPSMSRTSEDFESLWALYTLILDMTVYFLYFYLFHNHWICFSYLWTSGHCKQLDKAIQYCWWVLKSNACFSIFNRDLVMISNKIGLNIEPKSSNCLSMKMLLSLSNTSCLSAGDHICKRLHLEIRSDCIPYTSSICLPLLKS